VETAGAPPFVPEVFEEFGPDLLSPEPEGFPSFDLLSEAGFAGVLTGTGAFAPGFAGASLVEAATGAGVTADAASPAREFGCADFASRVEDSRAEEGFFSSFFGSAAEAESPSAFSSAAGPTRTPLDCEPDARAHGAQSAAANAAAKRYFFISALFLACPLRVCRRRRAMSADFAALAKKGTDEPLVLK
jgi:hypothetical protein